MGTSAGNWAPAFEEGTAFDAALGGMVFCTLGLVGAWTGVRRSASCCSASSDCHRVAAIVQKVVSILLVAGFGSAYSALRAQ
jgi:hypothetical protein